MRIANKDGSMAGSRTDWMFPWVKQRREEAAYRQELYEGMTVSARIYQAKNRRGESKKEMARLLTQVKS